MEEDEISIAGSDCSAIGRKASRNRSSPLLLALRSLISIDFGIFISILLLDLGFLALI